MIDLHQKLKRIANQLVKERNIHLIGALLAIRDAASNEIDSFIRQEAYSDAAHLIQFGIDKDDPAQVKALIQQRKLLAGRAKQV